MQEGKKAIWKEFSRGYYEQSYAYVRSKTKVKEVVDSNNQVVSDNEVMCEILDEYFGSVFTSENVNNALP